MLWLTLLPRGWQVGVSSLAIKNGVMLGAGDRKGVDYSTTTREMEREEGRDRVDEGAACSEMLGV